MKLVDFLNGHFNKAPRYDYLWIVAARLYLNHMTTPVDGLLQLLQFQPL